MALVQKIEKADLERNSVHGPADCTYSAFTEGGRRYFQLDTYGSKGRKFTGKKSQTIQLDAASARALVELLVKEFHFA
jgi:hypothetical protein